MSFSHDICTWNGTNFYLSFYSKINVSTSYINNLRISALLGCGSSQLSYDESHSQVLSTSLLFLENVYRTLDLWEQILNHSMEQLSTLCLSPQTLRKNSNLKYQYFFHSKDRMRVVETKLITYQMGLRHPHTAGVYSLRIEDNPEMFSICCLIIARIMILLSYNSKLQCWNFYDSEENEIYKIKVSLSFFSSISTDCE